MSYRDWYWCKECGHTWQTRKRIGEPPSCPRCRGRSISNISESEKNEVNNIDLKTRFETFSDFLTDRPTASAFWHIALLSLLYGFLTDSSLVLADKVSSTILITGLIIFTTPILFERLKNRVKLYEYPLIQRKPFLFRIIICYILWTILLGVISN